MLLPIPSPACPTRRRRTLLVTLLTLVLAGVGFAAPATAAPSSPVISAGCQASSAAFKLYGAGWTIALPCSGTSYVDRTATRFEAHGLSGIVYYNTSATWAFCDGEKWNFPYHARKVVLYATKASWC